MNVANEVYIYSRMLAERCVGSNHCSISWCISHSVRRCGAHSTMYCVWSLKKKCIGSTRDTRTWGKGRGIG
jgi:hypothetical protein